MKYALIGCGRISYNHIAAAMANDLEITAVCDIVPSRMENKVETFHLPKEVKQYTDYHEIMRFFLLCIICYLIVKIFECLIGFRCLLRYLFDIS